MRRLSPAARRATVLVRAGLAALLLAPLAAAQPADDARAFVFSHVAVPTIAVGEAVALRVDVLAAPTTEAALETLVDAFERAAPDADSRWSVEVSTGVTVERTGRVATLSRTISLRALRVGRMPVPAVSIAPGLASRPHDVTVFRPSDALSRVTVAHLDVSGRVRGVGFSRTGTAFLVAPDRLVTAYHVVAGARRVTVTGPTGRSLRAGAAWALDPSRDVAVLAVDPEDARAAGLVVLPLDATPDRGLAAATMRDGRAVVARRFADVRADGERLFVSASGVHPGDSGGPLLSPTGAVLGVVVSGRATEGEADLLREDIALAADLRPTLADAWAAERPERLTRALARLTRDDAAAQAMEAASALQIARPAERPAAHAAALRAIAGSTPDRVTLQFLVGSAFEAAGRPSDAVGAFASAWAGGYVPAAYALAHYALRAGQTDDALALFERVREAPPYAHLGAFGVAQAAVAASDYAAAEAALADVLDHDPAFGPALYLLGVVRLAQGRVAEAQALRVRLGPSSEWAAGLALMIRSPGLRPETLRPLPPLALASGR